MNPELLHDPGVQFFIALFIFAVGWLGVCLAVRAIVNAGKDEARTAVEQFCNSWTEEESRLLALGGTVEAPKDNDAWSVTGDEWRPEAAAIKEAQAKLGNRKVDVESAGSAHHPSLLMRPHVAGSHDQNGAHGVTRPTL